MKSKFDIVCFSDSPWDTPIWTNKQHIMSRVSKLGHNVLFIDPPLSVSGWYKWWRSGRVKFSNLFKWIRKEDSNLTIFSPIVLPPRFGGLRYINNLIRLRGIKRLISRLGFKNHIVWIYHPDAAYFLGKTGEKFILYDCVDQFSAFPAYSDSRRKREIESNEMEVLEKANVVITTSSPLYDIKQEYNPNTYLVENVGDIEHFAKARSSTDQIPSDMKSIKKPVMGFIGSLDAYKVDLDLIKYAAITKPNWSFVLIGPVGEGDRKTDLSVISELHNVHILGIKPYALLPDYIRSFDVCMIPYNINEYNHYSFPLKVYEFLASGKPVVSMNLPSIISLSEVIKIATTYDSFIKCLSEALEKDSPEAVQKRIEAAGKNSWDHRVKQILDIIRDRRQK